MQMRQILKAMGTAKLPEVKPMEINPSHPIIARLSTLEDETVIAETSRLLLEQALLIEGGSNIQAHAKRMRLTLPAGQGGVPPFPPLE